MLREEWRRSRRGKKVADGRCGRTIEAEPVSDQTCLIEPAEEVAHDCDERNMTMAAFAYTLPCPSAGGAEIDVNSSGWGVASAYRRDIVVSRFVAWRNYASADKAVYR